VRGQSVFLPTALLAALVAGAFYAPGTRSSNSRPTSNSGEESPSLRSPGITENHTGALEAVDLLASYLDVDISPREIAQRVSAAADRLAGVPTANDITRSTREESLHQRRADAALIEAFAHLGFTELAPGVRELKGLGRVIRERTEESTDRPSIKPTEHQLLKRFLKAELDEVAPETKSAPYAVERVARDLAHVDMAPLRLKLLRDHADGEHREIQFLIVTLPDAVDSYVGWYFDPMLDGMRRAIEVQDYVMDRFYFPDWTPGRDGNGDAVNRSKLHERYPALILFRDKNDSHKLLLTLIVSETPTAGLHEAAFQRATKFVIDWTAARSTTSQTGQYQEPIRIIGPIFSGSASSLAHAIANVSESAKHRFQVITGTATAVETRDIITSVPNVTFAATTHDSLTLQHYAERFIDERVLAHAGDRASHYAVLRESNTGYGQLSLSSDAQERRTSALTVPFPLHVSRLPADGDPSAMPQNRPFGLPLLRPLPLDDARIATDRLPPMSPLAEPAAELLLSTVVQTLGGERDVVGIVATDVRDTLFLTERVGQLAPNTLVYGVGSDLLYNHPDFSRWTRGMLLASTYPLYTRNQLWTYPFSGERKRDIFYSSNAEALFNAATLQLASDVVKDPANPPGARGGIPAMRLRMRRPTSSNALLATGPLEYQSPFTPCAPGVGCAPPVWISVVGRDRIWPIAVYQLPNQSGTKGNYITRVEPAADGKAPPEQLTMLPDPLSQSRAALALAILFVAGALIHGITFWRACAHDTSSYLSHFGNPVPFRGESELARHPSGTLKNLLACHAAVLAVAVYVTLLVSIAVISPAATSGHGSMVSVLLVVASVAATALTGSAVAWLLMQYLRQQVRYARDKCRKDSVTMLLKLVNRAILGMIGVFALVAYGAFLKEYVVAGASRQAANTLTTVMWYERSVHILSGVSPLVPLLAIAASVYLWAVQGLRRHVLPEDVKLYAKLFVVNALTEMGDPPEQAARRSEFVQLIVLLSTIAAYTITCMG